MIEAIERTLELRISPAKVWRALTDASEIASWFGDSAELEPRLGAEGWFGWDSYGRAAVRIEAFEPETRLVWRWAREADKPLDEVHSTVVEWTLIPRPDGGTTLKLEESGFEREQDREENVGGWQHELAHLTDHLAAT